MPGSRAAVPDAHSQNTRWSPSASGLPPDWHFVWDERAAILEIDMGLSRERAEELALEAVRRQMVAAAKTPGIPRDIPRDGNGKDGSEHESA